MGSGPPALHWSALWGVAGILLLLGEAVWRLTPRAIDALTAELTLAQWAALVIVVAFMAYVEGYKGFQRAFAPRAAVRAMLARRRGWAAQLLAPLFCMALFDATRRRMIAGYSLVIGIVGLVFALRLVPMPWRGIADAGVVVGLSWGMVSLVVSFAKAATGRLDEVSPELDSTPATGAEAG